MNDISSGTQFDFTYAPGTSAEQILAFEMAGEVWSSYLNDDVAVRIYVESTSDLPDEVVGAALPGKKRKEKYEKVKEALAIDASSASDSLAFANLPGDDKEFSILIDGQELDETKEFRLTNANAKSLGLLKDERDKLDGYILVNDLASNPAVGWDYDALRSGGGAGNKIDFLSVAMHEIGHVLGFVSGIDDSKWLNVLTESQEKEKEIKGKDFKFASSLDLYRYSDSSLESGNVDLSVGGNPFFSIDGGSSRLGNFANGEYTELGGDGYQASHWQQYSSQGIMNPVLPNGERRNISSLDLTAMDVIGWDVNTAGAPSWSQMYDNAVAGAETALVQDREKDVEKLIKESDYEVRRSRYARGRRYSAQLGGFWQYTTVNPVSNPEAIDLAVEDTSIVDAEADNLNGGVEPVSIDNAENTIISDPNESIATDLAATEIITTENNPPINAIEPTGDRSLDVTNANPDAAEVTEGESEASLDTPVELLVIEDDNSELDNNNDIDGSENAYLGTTDDRYFDTQYVTGIENNGQDSLIN